MTNDQPILELIRAVEEATSSISLLNAVRSLAAAHHVGAIDPLIKVLGYNNPGAAVAAVDGLIALGEPAVLPLLQQLDGYNYGARAWAVRALAGIGDPRGLEVLRTAAETDFALSVRRAAAKGLGSIRWFEMNADEMPAAQARAIQSLLLVCQDPEWIVRYAAVVGLQALATQLDAIHPQIQDRFEEMALKESELAVRARVVLAQQKILAKFSVGEVVQLSS